MGDKKVKIPNCWICMDTGFVLYRKKVDDYESEYVSSCTCSAGAEYAYDGARCEKKSPYRIPSVAEVLDPEDVAVRNFREWYERYKDEPGVKLEALYRRARGECA